MIGGVNLDIESILREPILYGMEVLKDITVSNIITIIPNSINGIHIGKEVKVNYNFDCTTFQVKICLVYKTLGELFTIYSVDRTELQQIDEMREIISMRIESVLKDMLFELCRILNENDDFYDIDYEVNGIRGKVHKDERVDRFVI